MNLNLGSVSGNTLELGYTGAFTGGGVTYPYVLTAHGTPHPNSIMAGNTFDTTGTVELRIITDADPSIIVVDWQAMSDNQEWLTDIDAASSVTTVAAGTTTIELGYRIVEDGTTGTFSRTITAAEPAADTTPDAFAFTDLTGQALNATVESDPIIITGVDAGEDIPASITGGSYAVSNDDGATFGGYTTANTTVQLNDQIKVQHDTANDFETAVNTEFTAGGVSDTFTSTTRAAVLPALTLAIPDLNFGQGDTVSLDLNTYFSGATSYALTGLPAGSGLSFSGSQLTGTTSANDIAASPFTLTAEAFSADGSITDGFAVAVLGDAPVIAFSAPLTTTDTSPIVSGTAGAATSITLTVNGQTYTPAVTSGQWSQQLPTLAPNSYPMTLNGEDAEGVPAEEVQATLLIIEAVVNADVAASSFRFGF